MCEIQIATLDLKGPNIFVTNLKLAHFIRKTTWNCLVAKGLQITQIIWTCQWFI
jgi:hypothetical protein